MGFSLLITPGKKLMLAHPVRTAALLPCSEYLPVSGVPCSRLHVRGQALGTTCTGQAGFGCSEEGASEFGHCPREKLDFGKIM